MSIEPVIKWSGSKRSQAADIISRFPKEIGTYHEPFCGGCAVARALADDKERSVERFDLSDNNKDLINLWNALIYKPDGLADGYRRLREELGRLDNVGAKRDFYNTVRKQFNESRESVDFLFLTRTCANGLIRFNSKGEFNSPFHLTRDGIQADRMERIIWDWHAAFEGRAVFICRDYKETVTRPEDWVYIDPPYAKTNGMYASAVPSEELFEWMGTLECGYALSYDENFKCAPPEGLWDESMLLLSGNSSFRRLFRGEGKRKVMESLYVRR